VSILDALRRRMAMTRITTLETYQGLSARMKSNGKKPPTSEIVSTPSSMIAGLITFIQALDPGLITTTGKSILEEQKGLEIFGEMMRDPQIRASIGVKKYAIISNRWNLFVATGEQDNAKAREIRDFVNWNLSCLLGDTGIGLDAVLSAFEYGRSDCEIVWDVVRGGRFDGFYYIKELKPKNIGYIAYELDKFDNIISFKVTDKNGQIHSVPPERMVHYAWNAEFGNPYGIPDLSSCYMWYWLKKTMYKFLAIYGEKFASPIPVFTLEKTISSSERAILEQAAKDFQVSNSFILPKGVSVEMKENNGSGGDFYMKGIVQCDSQMSRAICFQTLTTNENAKTGTHSQATVHENTLWYLLKKIQDDLEKVVEKQMIAPIVSVNFTGSEYLAPRFGFEIIDPDKFAKIATAIKELCTPPDGLNTGIVDLREEWIRDHIGIPQRDLEKFPFPDDIKAPPPAPAGQGPTKEIGNGPGKPKPAIPKK
jgi:phage gp29-like protein